MSRGRLRLGVAWRLAPATLRLVPWWHLAVGAVIAAGVVWLRWDDPWHTVPAAVHSLRLAMLPLALSAAFVLDDPTERTLAACPVPVSLRRTLRVAFVLPVLAAVWAGLLTFAAAAPSFDPASNGTDAGAVTTAEVGGFLLPVVALSVEFAGLVAVTLAAAGLADRATGGDSSGLAAAPVTLAVTVGLWMLPERHGFYVPYVPAPPSGQSGGAGWSTWVDAHWRWTALATLCAAALGWASRDLGRRHMLTMILTKEDRLRGGIWGGDHARMVDGVSVSDRIR